MENDGRAANRVGIVANKATTKSSDGQQPTPESLRLPLTRVALSMAFNH